MEININRRFPVYEFVVRVSGTLDACEAVLRQNIDPLPGLVASMRADAGKAYGSVDGSTFTFRPLAGILGGTTRPIVSGYVVPESTSVTDVLVVVRLSWWSWAFVLAIWLMAVTAYIGEPFAQLAEWLNAVWTLALVTVGATALHLVEARRIRKAVEGWFGRGQAAA
jgi:hypothetical protein